MHLSLTPQIISLTTTLTYAQTAVKLGSECNHDMVCSDVIKGSLCSMEGYCECKPYYAQFNETSCVQGEYIIQHYLYALSIDRYYYPEINRSMNHNTSNN